MTLHKIKILLLFFLLYCSLLQSQCKNDESTGKEEPVDTTTNNNNTFTNPLLSSGPDPWVVQKDGFYYYTHTLGNRIGIIKTEYISNLSKGTFKTIWNPPASGNYSKNIWAPEIHFINNKWYIYFAADDGNDVNHRLYVLENSSADPLQGNWEFKGKITDSEDKWAIDGTIFNYKGDTYFIWSGWKGNNNPGNQQIYIAKMSNPWTLVGERVMISEPTYAWEKNGMVNEGPEVLKNKKGTVFLTYSASGCWTDSYAIGLLTLKQDGNPLNPTHWTKNSDPVISTNTVSNAYGPGHNGFFKSADGTEDWIIYHANSSSAQGCGNNRNPRIQKITWSNDSIPEFGTPVKINTMITKPSGEAN